MNSQIILAKNINLDRDYINVLNYTEQQMLALCREKQVASSNNFSFIRTQGTIWVDFNYSDCLQSNYIAFQNPDYSNKWFFAFIDDVIYKGNKNVEIKYTIDAWSTWFSLVNLKKCFIVRQHVLDDTIGLHTIPENLDVGDVIQESVIEDASYGNEFGYWIAIASNWFIKDNSDGTEVLDRDKGEQYAGISVYDNSIFGSELFLFQITSINDFINVVLFLFRTNEDGHIADVENMFILPNVAIDVSKLTQHTASMRSPFSSTSRSFNFYTISYDMSAQKFDNTITKRTSFSDFTPKNNKCFVFPYNYLYVSNNQGSSNIYKYENFSSENCVFENQFSITIGGSGRVVPKNYKGMSTNDDEALALGKYPTCAWSSDAFTNWLTQNSVNLAVSTGLIAGSIAGGINSIGISTMAAEEGIIQQAPNIVNKTSSASSSALSVSSNIAGLIGQFYQACLMPNIRGGQATGDIIWAANRNMFSFRQMRAKTEYLRIIDDYFTRFGYKINRLEMPNITGRAHWNYIEIGSSEEIGTGEIPTKFMEIINNACKKGVTIWHNHSEIGNYNLNNTIV